jgi:hypothetical protein
VPFVFLSIVWAISIHTVTAFLYCGLGGRPFLEHRLAGAALPRLGLRLRPRVHHPRLSDLGAGGGRALAPGPRRTLVGIIRVTCLINLFLLGCELFTEFYTGGAMPRPAPDDAEEPTVAPGTADAPDHAAAP